MRYLTRDFGEIEIEGEQIINFSQPIFGFDTYLQYAILHDPDVGMDVSWLQSLDESDLCFVLVSPDAVSQDYRPQFPTGLHEMIGEGEYEFWLIAVIQEDFTKSTVNLKSPVVVNWKTGLGAQVILDGDYPVRRPLIEDTEGVC